MGDEAMSLQFLPYETDEDDAIAIRAKRLTNYFTRLEIKFGSDAIEPQEIPIKLSTSGWMSPRQSKETNYLLQ